jgi:hypothetical protein
MTSDLDLQLSDYQPSLMDKTFLVGRKIRAAYKLGKHAALFVCERKQPHLMLKCSTGGSTHFHRIEADEVPLYLEAFKQAQRLM